MLDTSFNAQGATGIHVVAVLRRLKDWIIGFEEPEAIFLWLCGDAGAGKSSIAQSLCAQLAQEGQLLGSFFFWRNDPERSTHIALVATLFYQAVIALPGLGDLVAAVVEQDPAIFNKHFKIQLISLLINPINTLISTTDINPSSIPSVIVIDGLDECSGRDIQCSLLSSLACAIPKCNLRWRVLISSRPEVEIKSVFNSKPLLDLSCRLALHASFETDTDIRNFLVDTFDNIKQTHPLKSHIQPSWPGGDVIYQLVQRSSGQFIFASTVGRYISEPRQKPTYSPVYPLIDSRWFLISSDSYSSFGRRFPFLQVHLVTLASNLMELCSRFSPWTPRIWSSISSTCLRLSKSKATRIHLNIDLNLLKSAMPRLVTSFWILVDPNNFIASHKYSSLKWQGYVQSA